MIQYEPHSIRERLTVLYTPEDADNAYKGIRELINGYRERITSYDYHLSEKDAILITYGDQVQSPPEPPLKELNDFLVSHIDGLVNAVHLLPFYPYSSDDGFSVVDYKAVDPHCGSWSEVEQLGTHFRLMFDAVINHVSQFSDWFKKYLEGDPDYANFFIDADPTQDLSSVVRPRTSPLLHEFKDAEGRIRYIWTTFSRDQVDLNYANYKVLLAVLDALFFYIEKGATLLRLDAIAFVWKEIGTPSVHLPQTHELIQLMREVLHKVAPEVIIITETNVPHQENISYFGSGDDEAQMVYNFALPPLLAHSVLTGSPAKLLAWARTLTLPSDKVCFFNFTASHDGVGLRPVSELLDIEDIAALEAAAKRSGGLVSYRANADGTQSPYELNCSYIDLLTPPDADDAVRAKRMLLTQAVALAMPGVPGIYFHSLFGSRNYLEGVKMTGINRSINREKFNSNWLDEQLQKEGGLERRVYLAYKRLLSIRINETAFDPFGPFIFLDLHPSLFCLQRESRELDSHILAVHNFSGETVRFHLPDYLELPATECISNIYVTSETLQIESYGVMWIKCRIDVEAFEACCNQALPIINEKEFE
ncbi:sugar phosphorylase [Sulfurimonas sp. HSL1-2]|uniref:sugar phosphorylase n=1 Tax=Thiomicrolovo zhangzhouensis TaxID=3131933 RepID=UPI0031F97EC7